MLTGKSFITLENLVHHCSSSLFLHAGSELIHSLPGRVGPGLVPGPIIEGSGLWPVETRSPTIEGYGLWPVEAGNPTIEGYGLWPVEAGNPA